MGLDMADGSHYDGSIIKGTKTRHGFGRLTTADSTIYEGNWRYDELPYGQRTSWSSNYRGQFDKDLKNGRTRQTLWSAVQMLTQKLCCQTIHDCPKVVPLHYESE